MSAKSNTDSYLCVNIPETGSHLQNDFQKGLIKFTDLAINSNI